MAMSLQPEEISPVPEETRRVARAAFPKGNLYLRLRDEIGTVFDDPMFAALFPARGQPAACPWRLALMMVMQFIEGLSDRQCAEAVRGRIDWKYALGLELADPGCDASVLCEFRSRLIDGAMERQLLDIMLARYKDLGLVKARGRQRADSTHVLAAVRRVNRLEFVGETLRAALNALAVAAPDWLSGLIEPDWIERYSTRVAQYKLPKGDQARAALADQIGADGHGILAAVFEPEAPAWLRHLRDVETLRIAWVHQFHVVDEHVRLRDDGDVPPASLRFDSPYDRDTHYGRKRGVGWSGYKVHLTETCDADAPHVIVDVETTPAPTDDSVMTAPIQRALAERDLPPSVLLLDAGYVSAPIMVEARRDHDVEIVGPVPANNSWQAKAGQGFEATAFEIDWDTRTAVCPQGQVTTDWQPTHDRHGVEGTLIRFKHGTCAKCPARASCTHLKKGSRTITLPPRPQYEVLTRQRQCQTTEEWRALYSQRAGIEGTLSQGVRAFGLRKCRYAGLVKTSLQHVFTALAINIVRVDAWLTQTPIAKTRRSQFNKLALSIV
jgi:transposase